MNCGNETKMNKCSSQWTQFMHLRKEAWKKFRTSTGFEPVTSRLPVRCSSNPVEVLNFFQASLRNCINCVHCDDHFFIFKLFTVSIKRGMFLLANSIDNSRHCIAISFSRRLWRWIQNLIIEESMGNFWGNLPNSVLAATFGHCLFTPKVCLQKYIWVFSISSFSHVKKSSLS